ncbi:MAG: hypothetical protein IKU84_06230 [Clostridia bacterium]|nr:hypothetical protein [Clostridia bacterium]
MRELAIRLISRRTAILEKYPFYGRLLMHLPFALEKCGTAYTDSKKIVFDPEFIRDMTDRELDFLILHEVMHCVLCHCTRGRGKLAILYNIACDIVVNSLLLDMFGPLKLKGSTPMHTVPDHSEGRLYTAEKVYEMLLQDNGFNPNDFGLLDEHNWENIDDVIGESVWSEHIKEAAMKAGAGNVPLNLKRHVERICKEPKISWREVLCNFIKNDRADFDFTRPDRRFQAEDFLLPSFVDDMCGESVRDIWFVVDASGSVSDEMLTDVLSEIQGAISAVDSLHGLISFFDVAVTTPAPFETREELSAVEIIGGGGTSFKSVFNKIPEFFPDEKPCAIIVMTDGEATFPDEVEALDIPVLWIIVNSSVEPPWGEVIHI